MAEYRAVISRVQLPHSLTWVPDGDRRITTHYFLYKDKCIDYLSISLEPTQAYAFIKLDKKSREKCYIGPIRLAPGIISEAVLNEAIRKVLEANSFLRGQPKYLSACLNLIDREIPPLPLLTYNPTLEHCDTGNMSPYINLPHATIARVWGRLAYTYSVGYKAHSPHYGGKMTVMVVPNNRDNYSLLIELMILDLHNSKRSYSYIPIGPIVSPLPISEGILYGMVRDTVLDARDQLYREGARGCHPGYFIPVYYNRAEVAQTISNLLGEWRHIRCSLCR
jgi:hypothetical protein